MEQFMKQNPEQAGRWWHPLVKVVFDVVKVVVAVKLGINL